MIRTSTEWDSLKHKAGEIHVLARLYYGAEGASDYIAVSDVDIRLGGENYLGVLSGIPVAAQDVDIDSHLPTIATLQLKIDNLEYQPGKRFSDLLEELGSGSDLGFENRKADIRLWIGDSDSGTYTGITTFANCFPLREYGITRLIEHDHSETIFTIEDGTEIYLTKVEDLVASTDAADSEQLPEESNGRTKPIIHGSHLCFLGDTDTSKTTFDRVHNFVKAVYLGFDEDHKHHWFIAGHQIDDNDDLWGYDSDLGRMVKLSSYTVETNTASGCIISHSNGEEFYDYFFPAEAEEDLINSQNSYTINNVDRAANKDIDNYCEMIAADSSNPNRNVAAITIKWNDWENAGLIDAYIFEVKTYIKFLFNNKTYSDNEYAITNPGSTDIIAFTTSTYGSETNAATQAGIVADLGIEIGGATDAGSPDSNSGRVYQVFRRIKYRPKDIKLLPLYFGGKGKEYGTWINSRATGDGYSETHADNEKGAGGSNDDADGTGVVIQNAAGVIEAWLRDEHSMATAYIDEDSFNIYSNDVASMLLSNGITTGVNSREQLAEILHDFRAFLWWSTEGKYKIKAIEDTYSSADRSIDARDVRNLRFTRTATRQIKTAVKVKYCWNGDAYQLVTSLAQDTTLQTRYNITAAQSTLIHETKHILDTTTAEALRDFLLAWNKQPHNLASGELPKIHLDLDIGDIIQFSNMDYKVRGEDITGNVTRGGQTIYKYWFIYGVARSNVNQFRAIQLHDLS